tara:strand:- start:679 stop:1308 length:630 start_codon:yes stop_codon:yes gene_type:complete
MIANEDEAREYCRTLCDAAAMERFDRFIPMLLDESARQNLISAASLDSVWQRHIADSVQLLAHVPHETSLWLDLGTGAGFPGLVIALARPEMAIRLVESRKKRITWLESVRDHFDLSQCEVFGSRLEHVESFPAGVISGRAFAPLDRLVALSARFSTPDTHWLLPKGRSAAQELAMQPANVQRMFHVERSATDPEAGILIGRGQLQGKA